MRDIHKMCRICLGQGSREIFGVSLTSNILARDDLGRIAEKLRFVTMLKVNPKENLPQQICDLCIVQLNVSYNFKRLALKNDFQIRQYMIENGMSLSKDDDDGMERTTALEIHQIQHNVIRTNRYRQIAAPEIRRNSTTSSVSGASTMIINGRENDATPSNTANNFVHPRPIVRPIQVKIEPIDPEDVPVKEVSPVTSSPSNSSEPASIVTISSISTNGKQSPPMVVINGIINNESFNEEPKIMKKSSAPAPLSVKLGLRKIEAEKSKEKLRDQSHNLRTIKKTPANLRKSNRKLRNAIKGANKRPSTRKQPKKEVKKLTKSTSVKVVNKKDIKAVQEQKRRGRPPKIPGSPKMTYNKKNKNEKKRS